MMDIANCLITVMRGTEANAYGDLSDVGTPIYEHMPAAITETSKTVFDPATQRPQTIRSSMCVLPSWADVLDSDTIQREDTGDFFMIQSIERQPMLIGAPPDIILTLRWRSGVSPGSD
jgi:hypothetical protein